MERVSGRPSLHTCEALSILSMNSKNFEKKLREENYAPNTILAYLYAVQDFFVRYGTLNKENVLRYKTFLMENYKPRTVNLRIRGVNKYLEFTGHPELSAQVVRIPRSSFLENVITNEDYLFFKRCLKKEKDLRWYFVVWTLAATGARISELLQIRIEDVRDGHFDIYSKGGKYRRIYIPAKLRKQLLQWQVKESGYLFLNARGKRITPRGLSMRLKAFALKYGIDPSVVHPHSFRHLYAKNFLRKNKDLVLLADLMGHESIDTTRIYLQQSTREQSALINRIVDW